MHVCIQISFNFRVTMLLSRSTCMLRQHLQHKFLAVVGFHVPECNSYRENTYKYEQTRNYKNFGHTRRKTRFYTIVPSLICVSIMFAQFFDWQK